MMLNGNRVAYVKFLDSSVELLCQSMAVSIVVAKVVTPLTSVEISVRKSKTDLKKKENTTQKDRDCSTQMMKNCNLVMNTTHGTRPKRNSQQ